MREFHKANTLPAGYLFHGDDEAGCGNEAAANATGDREVWDLADLTPQCGRRGDSLKLALSWIYYGTSGFEKMIDHAFELSAYFAAQVNARDGFVLVSPNPPPCLQVCFYYAPGGLSNKPEENTRRTAQSVQKLIRRGFMVDYAPGEQGSFFRVVVNIQTRKGTVDGLIKAIEEVGRE
jgi:glutamate decarboxylase